MKRRRRPVEELKFGSDSFLDVVANLVGILIILIVVAGLRVSKTAVVPMPEGSPSLDESMLSPLASAVTGLLDSKNERNVVPQFAALQSIDPQEEEPESEPEPPPIPSLVVPRELVEFARELESEIAALQTEEEKVKGRIKLSKEQQQALINRHREIQNRLAEKQKQVSDSKKQAAIVEADLDLARDALVRLTKQVEEIESVPEHVETLEHRITPVSRVVNGKEKHYRLEKNRVAEVPIGELVGRFRQQIERRKEWLVKTRQHQGQIGPINGFSMQYLVRVESMSDLDLAKGGYGGFRINLAQWEIHAESDAIGETEEAALRKGSLFYQSMLGTGHDTTLTFWVYPDSYSLYRKLQKFTHDHGFSVAARPLPHGVPIAGSPNGSRSASQ